MFALMLLQASPDDVAREMERLQRNFTFLNSGLWVAWAILVIYVLMMVGRERKLKREIAGLKAMLEDKPRSSTTPLRSWLRWLRQGGSVAQFVGGAADYHVAGLQIPDDLDVIAVGGTLFHVYPLGLAIAIADDEGAFRRGDDAGLGDE